MQEWRKANVCLFKQKLFNKKMCKVAAEFLEPVYMIALTFFNKRATSELLNLPRTAIPPSFHQISSKSKDGGLLFSEISKGSFSDLKFEEVQKIQRKVLNAKKIILYINLNINAPNNMRKTDL